jgi:hypothetical protein
MAQILFDLVDPADLTRFVRGIPNPADFILERFVPNRLIAGIKYRVQNRNRTNHSAKFRVYDAETPIGRRQATITQLDGLLPPVGEKLVVNEFEQLLLDMARTGAAGTPTELLTAVYDDAENLTISIRAAMEKTRGNLLIATPVVITLEGGQTLEADFGVPGGNTPVAPILWSASNATPLTNELAWCNQLATTDGVSRPAFALTSSQVYGFLGSNEEYRQAYFGYAAAGASFPMLNRQQVDTVRSNFGLPPIVLYDVQIDGAPVIPVNRFCLIQPDPAGTAETQFGTTAESLILGRGTNPRIAFRDAPGLVGVVQEEGDPARPWTKVAAVAMPVAYNPSGIFCARVLA